MRAMGIDCALITGWAIAEKGKIVRSGVMDFKKNRPKDNGQLFLEYRRWMSQMTLSPNPRTGEKVADVIIYEKSHHRGGASTDLGLNMTGRVQEAAAAAGIPCVGVHSSTLKKFATGKGKVEKELMIEAADKILTMSPKDNNGQFLTCKDDNEADAIHLAMWGLKHGTEAPEEETEKEETGIPDGDETPDATGGEVPTGQEGLDGDLKNAQEGGDDNIPF